jgi:hypothetical protein
MNTATSTPAGGGRLRALLPTLLDIVVPVVLYFVLKKVGFSDFWALTAAGVGTGVWTLYTTIKRGKLDWIGILVILEIILTVALLFVTNDPRVVAIKPAFYTALTGLYFFFTCVVGKPIVYLAVTPMATEGDPVRTEAYNLAWVESPKFRLIERGITAMFGLVLVVEAILRIFIVYHYSVDKLSESFVISQLPGLVLIVAALGFVRLQVPVISKIVDGIQERLKNEHARQIAADAPSTAPSSL